MTRAAAEIHFEPLCGVGRASDRDLEVQSVLPSFVKNFRQAQVEGLRRGVDVTYSTARMDGLRTSFCGAYGANLNFCVSTEGVVSSCYEVLEASDPRAELFVYGRFDREIRDFQLDHERMQRLVELDVTSIGRCQDCFLKWNCGGDCIAKASLGGLANVVGDAPLERCGPSREIARDVLLQRRSQLAELGGLKYDAKRTERVRAIPNGRIARFRELSGRRSLAAPRVGGHVLYMRRKMHM